VSATSLGKVRDALPVFEKAIGIDGECATAHANLGLALWRLGRQHEAEAELREAVRLRPDHVVFQRNLGRVLLALEQAQEALECFERIIATEPSDAEAQMDAGDALFALDRHSEAEAAYGRGLMADPKLAASRASSSEARLAILLERVRAEVKTEPTPARRVSDTVLAVLDVAGDKLGWLKRVPRSLRLAKIAIWVALAVVLHAAWVAVPAYLRHYAFKDEVAQIGRASVRDDHEVLERLMHAVREHGLERHIREQSFHIETGSKWRKIECSYEVPLLILPGLEHKMRFQLGVEEPFLLGPDPVFF
jgi:tetratricopeptide (TPR) repeat protein